MIQIDISNEDVEKVLGLCNSLQFATLGLSLDLYITHINPIAELLFLQPSHQLMHKSLHDICQKLGIESPIAVSTLPETLNNYSATTTHWLANQKIVTVHWSVSRCFNDKGYTGYILVGKTMLVCDEKKPLVNIETIMRALPCAIFSKDMNGYCLSANAYQADIAGLRHEKELIGKHAVDLPGFIPDPQVIHKADMLALTENTTIVVEEHATLKNGKKTSFLVTKSPFRDEHGKLLGVIGTAVNTSYQQPNFAPQSPHLPFPLNQKITQTYLSKKEIECIQWMIKGKSSAETATIMHISKRTVETHMNNIKRKLNCYKQFQIGYLIGKYGYLLL
ncbi:MAG: hypothetical protein CK424_04740 [Legionella sp.]|nr:MAG: hypothetical protein CK424_04740 [Legionella sp.]